jgi:hypothetical protein
MRGESPASHDTPLGLAYGNVVSDDEEFDLAYLGWMLSSKLFLGKTKVEHVSRVISRRWSVDQLRELMEGLLDNNKRAINYAQNWVD